MSAGRAVQHEVIRAICETRINAGIYTNGFFGELPVVRSAWRDNRDRMIFGRDARG